MRDHRKMVIKLHGKGVYTLSQTEIEEIWSLKKAACMDMEFML